MIDQNLVNYINEQLRNGYTIESLRNYLIQQGYDANNVTDSVNYISGNPNQNNSITRNEKSGIKNSENIIYIGFWKRVIAEILDTIIFGIPFGLIQVGLFFFKLISNTYIIFVTYLAYIIIYIYMEGIKGGTPGKLILGMRIVNSDGKTIGIPKAALRYIGKIISLTILGIGCLMIGWDAKKQGLHDKIAHTYVIKV
jgi:uncharacterized RDD family membrane protein YckC